MNSVLIYWASGTQMQLIICWWFGAIPIIRRIGRLPRGSWRSGVGSFSVVRRFCNIPISGGPWGARLPFCVICKSLFAIIQFSGSDFVRTDICFHCAMLWSTGEWDTLPSLLSSLGRQTSVWRNKGSTVGYLAIAEPTELGMAPVRVECKKQITADRGKIGIICIYIGRVLKDQRRMKMPMKAQKISELHYCNDTTLTSGPFGSSQWLQPSTHAGGLYLLGGGHRRQTWGCIFGINRGSKKASPISLGF